MILSEFLRGRNVKINAVSNYISRNPDLFEGHVRREGKNTFLDDDAVRILDEKYPFAKPTVIINGLDPDEERALRERLQKAQEVIIQMQNELTDCKLLNAEKDANLRLIEDRHQRLEEETKALKEELEKERNKKWWQKLKGV